MNNLIVRTISGVILVAILVSGVLYSTLTSFIVLSVIALGSLLELGKLLKDKNIRVMRGFMLAVALFVLLLQGYNIIYDVELLTIAQTLLVLMLAFSLRSFIELYRKGRHPFTSISYEIFSFVYTVAPILLLNNIDVSVYVIMLFIIIWSNDVGAYLVGSTIGKHKLFERISPKKSWEGFFGGVIISVIFASLMAHYSIGTEWYIWAIIALVTALAGVVGDLFESLFKRSISIKDSGNIIPGHGGFLDRFDALIFAAPVYYVLLTIFGII